VTINPSFVIGPVLGRDFSASLEIVKKLLDGSVPVLPRFGFDLARNSQTPARVLMAMRI
jgi:dihydroflavonol-4-reductase